ncbi:aTP synthase subunit b [Coprobacillus sp. CAG:826]|jgi:F-type H+-transporting ATPase subunit b|nr:F0F1 ATP synthase subunit B [Coprobacillus sp.]CDD91915.1 aTP synthase subunit b [Coprobacillus sp. CAG:826]
MSNTIHIFMEFVTLFDLELDPQDFINKLFPNGWVPVVVQLSAFIVLAIAATFFLYKPVKKLLKERGDYVESHIHNAEVLDQEAQEKLSIANQEIVEKKKEAYQILIDARKEGEDEKARILSNAENEANKVREQAEVDIELSRQKAIDDVHNEMVNVALEASKALLGREVNKEDQERLIAQFIKDVDR